MAYYIKRMFPKPLLYLEQLFWFPSDEGFGIQTFYSNHRALKKGLNCLTENTPNEARINIISCVKKSEF